MTDMPVWVEAAVNAELRHLRENPPAVAPARDEAASGGVC